MHRSLHLQLKRELFSFPMFISIVIGLVFLLHPLCIPLFMSIKYASPFDYVFIFYTPHSGGVFDLFAPALAVLPAATVFCDDYNSGYIKSITMRTTKKKYIAERLLCNSIAGGFALAIPVLFIFAISLIFGEPYLRSSIPDGFSTFYADTVFENIQFVWGGLLVSVIVIALTFLFGMVWASIGLCVSAFLTNRYIALAFPIILYYSINILFSRLGFTMLSPVNTIMPNAYMTPSLVYVLVFQFILLFTSAILFVFGVNRRLKNV